MIPVRMQLTGFLSYLETVVIPFDSFKLACISGQNGAGKSSILDGMTWALFDRARGSGEDVINSRANAAEVVLDFEYENSLFRVQRSRARGKTSNLEFYIRDEDEHWRSLSESTIRDTQARIQKTLRMDYDTFVNASFFLQGKADQFSQQSPGDRKKILTSILGLEIWESYRLQAAKTIKAHEQERNIISGQLQTYDEEIDKEPQYKERLALLQEQLESLEERLKSKTEAFNAAVQQENLLRSLRKSLDEKAARLQNEQQRLDNLRTSHNGRVAERDETLKLLEHAAEIEEEYQTWQKDRRQLEYWEGLKSALGKVDEQRAAQRAIIEQKRAGLLAELNALRQRQSEKETLEKEAPGIEKSLMETRELETRLAEVKSNQTAVREQVQAIRLEMVELETNQQLLIRQRNQIDERTARLAEAEEEQCPVCKKPLTAAERQRMAVDLQSERAALEAHIQQINTQIQQKRVQTKSLNEQLTPLEALDAQLQQAQQTIVRGETRISQIHAAVSTFESEYQSRLIALDATLQKDDFEPEARIALAKLDVESKAVGYQPEEHAKVVQAELRGRGSEEAMLNVEKARAALEPLKREINSIETSIRSEEQIMADLTAEKQAAEIEYQEQAALLPDKSVLERKVYTLKEQTNIKRSEVGAAENNITNLKHVRERQTTLLAQRGEVLRQISRLKDLERAFSKDGVPALLIEQALPEIEQQANDLLERLSGGNMALKFETQADYKSSKRTDKKETLEIKISDSSGAYREYEMYSGGEAFRVNFAIRLALSRVLAYRAGARLQTLVIDEGFGSQDADGRQRLIEAINQVKGDFEKILVITHLEELKDAFPARIEVEKGVNGSLVSVQIL